MSRADREHHAAAEPGEGCPEVSTEQMTEKAKQTLKTMKELLERAEESTHKALERAAPTVQRSIDTSVEAAARGFSTTMQTIDGATTDDQLKLLKAYRKFLGSQADYVDGRIRALEEKGQEKEKPLPDRPPVPGG